MNTAWLRVLQTKTFEGNNRSNCDSIFQGAFTTTKVKEQCLLASPWLPTRAIEMPGHMRGGCHVGVIMQQNLLLPKK